MQKRKKQLSIFDPCCVYLIRAEYIWSVLRVFDPLRE